MDKAVVEISENSLKTRVRELYNNERVSIKKISELLGIEQVSVRYFLSSLC